MMNKCNGFRRTMEFGAGKKTETQKRKSISFKKKTFALFFIFWVPAFFLHSQQADVPASSDWVLAVAEFESDGLPAVYGEYKSLIPKLFLSEFNSGAEAKRLVPFEEKKMRAVMASALKKIALIKDRARLVEEKDGLFLSAENIKSKEKKRKKLEGDIKKKEKEILKAGTDIKIEEHKFFAPGRPKNVRLWNKDSSLYKVPEEVNLGETLKRENISAVIHGTIKDISGYMVLYVRLDTGVRGLKVYEFSGAGRYEEAEQIVKTLSFQVYSAIQNTRDVQVHFDVNPKNAKVYIDNRVISDFSKPVTLYEGVYDISASAENYLDAFRKIELKNKKAYTLKIDLKPLDTVKIGFNLENKAPHVFFKSQYAATVPGIITVPKNISILEFQQGDVNTFGLLDGGKIGSPAYIQNMIINLNKKNVKKSIERQRKILYWSLGALYVSIPITMILGAQYNEQLNSFRLQRLPWTRETVTRINNLGITHSVFQGITIALGVNYFIQLIIYLVKADRALPRKVRPNVKKPVYNEAEPLKTVKPLQTEGGRNLFKDNTKISTEDTR